MSALHRYTTLAATRVSTSVHPQIIEAHAGDAAFLWMMRSRAVNQQNYNLVDLARLDERLDAHLEGLQVAGVAGWDELEATLGAPRPQDIFAPVVWALRAGDHARLNAALEATGDDPAAWNAAVSACGWANETAIEPILRLLDSEPPALRFIALGACAVRGAAPGKDVLERILNEESEPKVRARALRMVGELGLLSYTQHLQHRTEDSNDEVKRAAAWSLAVFQAHARPLPSLLDAARGKPPVAEAFEMAARRLDAESVREFALALLQEGRGRQALRVASAAGFPALMDIVLKLMSVDETARLAGLAFSQITGADLAKLKLEREDVPTDKSASTPERETEDEELDEASQAEREYEEEQADGEAYLPVPDPELVTRWWRAEQARYAPNSRYVAGRALDEASLRQTLMDGTQPQRRAAAIELAMLSRGTPIYNTSQPGFEQARALLGWT